VTIYNIPGKEVSMIVDQEYHAGNDQITWDRCIEGSVFASVGVYLYRIDAVGHIEIRKMPLLKWEV
jgi:hypothetical protein